LVAGLLYGSYSDWRTREVSDRLWQAMAVVGTIVVVALAFPDGPRSVGLYLLAGGLVLEHLLPWDELVERWHPSLPGVIEIVVYAGLLVILLSVGLTSGIGPADLPIGVVAIYVTVILSRVLFEVGLLYGGADAKALMVAGLLVPTLASPLLSIPASAAAPLAVFPFSLTLLMNAALLALAVPLSLAARNIRRGDFEFPLAFTSLRIDVEELPRRFVWLRDPTFHHPESEEEREVETTEEDIRLRKRQRDELVAQGIQRVWVTPQLPFVILLAAGGVSGLIAGNLIYDLFALL
jgi:preflagellin peptidase FlaK